MKSIVFTRRQFIAAGVSAVGTGVMRAGQAGFGGATREGKGEPAIVRGLLRFSDSLWCFDPVGVFVKPGETVRFVNASIQMITVTAYHPANSNHELRIPDSAPPFDLDLGLQKTSYEWKSDIEGTYDFFSRHQELLGMIGRIIVGRPGGPGEQPWGWGGSQGRNPIYPEVRNTAKLLDSKEIVRRGTLPLPFEALAPTYPLYD